MNCEKDGKIQLCICKFFGVTLCELGVKNQDYVRVRTFY